MAQVNPLNLGSTATKSHKLPPLILHPFADAKAPDKLVDSSRASLIMQGLLPAGDRGQQDLDRALIEGRYQEIRMLFYVGRDLVRWIEQCVEHCSRQTELQNLDLKYETFAAYLVNFSPSTVEAKLRKWGVGDYRSIFQRALGLNAVMSEMPLRHNLSDEFIRNYYRYADQMYLCRQGQGAHSELQHLGFDFEIFASGEYSRRLEREWAEN